MSKFKVGDRVVFKDEGWRGRVVGIKDDGIHVVEFDDGSGDWFREDQLARNSALHSANPVVQNALNRKVGNAVGNAVRGNTKLKNIDYWFDDNGYGEDTLARYVAAYKRDRCINFVDRHADTAARDAFYDAMYQLTGIKSKWAFNAKTDKDNGGRALNASRSDAVLADFAKFVKAQMSAAIAALETAKRDISAQAETSAKAAMSMRSTDEHEIIRDYGTKTAMAIGEAVSKLKAAKDNPLIL